MIGSVIASFAIFLTNQMQAGPTAAELAAIKKLDFLVGKWEGTGWIQQGPQRQEYTGTEHVQLKLQGKALLIEGRFVENTTKKVIHETLAVLTFDEKSGKYKFNTYLYNRPNGEFELIAKPNGFSWQMKPTDTLVVDYVMNLENGVWVESGEVTLPGQGKTKFMEMRLKKL